MSSMELERRIAADDRLWPDFEAICDCGGRLAGSDSERRAVDLVARLGAQAAGVPATFLDVPYEGWRATRAELRLADGAALPCYPLVRSTATPPGGLTAEVVDLGRGAPEDFEVGAGALRGRIALVRHELMFAAGTIHRSRKYQMAREMGAAGFLIAGPLEGEIVAGSSGRFGEADLPAMGIAPESAAALAGASGGDRAVTMLIETEEAPAHAQNVMLELPGRGDGWVVLSAHVDGHEISESAMDNASGVAAVLAVTRALAGHVHGFERGLRVMFFNVEEWALTGSAYYAETLPQDERDRIALNINLDSVAGSPDLTALISGFDALEPFLGDAAAAHGIGLGVHRPLMMNSDHANFAAAGIPAFRLVAGFDDPGARLRHVLTPADTRDKVEPAELRRSALLAAEIARTACTATADQAAAWRSG